MKKRRKTRVYRREGKGKREKKFLRPFDVNNPCPTILHSGGSTGGGGGGLGGLNPPPPLGCQVKI